MCRAGPPATWTAAPDAISLLRRFLLLTWEGVAGASAPEGRQARRLLRCLASDERMRNSLRATWPDATQQPRRPTGLKGAKSMAPMSGDAGTMVPRSAKWLLLQWLGNMN